MYAIVNSLPQILFMNCMDPKIYWFLVRKLILDYWIKQRRFPNSSFSAIFMVLSLHPIFFQLFVLILQVHIMYWYNPINACNVQISYNLMNYFSNSLIFFCDASCLNFQTFRKKSLNLIVLRNIIEDLNCYA